MLDAYTSDNHISSGDTNARSQITQYQEQSRIVLCSRFRFLQTHRRKQDEKTRQGIQGQQQQQMLSMIIMMLSITAKKKEGIHSMLLQSQRHRFLLTSHPHPSTRSLSSSLHSSVVKGLVSQWILTAMSISSSFTHMIYPLHNESMIAMTTSSVKKSPNTRQLNKKKTIQASKNRSLKLV